MQLNIKKFSIAMRIVHILYYWYIYLTKDSDTWLVMWDGIGVGKQKIFVASVHHTHAIYSVYPTTVGISDVDGNAGSSGCVFHIDSRESYRKFLCFTRLHTITLPEMEEAEWPSVRNNFLLMGSNPVCFRLFCRWSWGCWNSWSADLS